MQAALAALAERHPLIKARIDSSASVPELVLQKPLSIEWTLRNTADVSTEQLRGQVSQDRNLVFQRQQGPLARFVVYRSGDGSDLLLLSVDAIVADEWSVTVLLRDLLNLYSASGVGPEVTAGEPEYSFQDFAEWQQKLLASEINARQLDDWIGSLEDAPAGCTGRLRRIPFHPNLSDVNASWDSLCLANFPCR